MNIALNTLTAYGESALAFLTAGCFMAPFSVPVTRYVVPANRGGVMSAVRGVTRSVNRTLLHSSEMRNCVNAQTIGNRLAHIDGRKEQVMQRLSNIYSRV